MWSCLFSHEVNEATWDLNFFILQKLPVAGRAEATVWTKSALHLRQTLPFIFLRDVYLGLQSVTIDFYNISRHRVHWGHSDISKEDAQTLFVPRVIPDRDQAKRILGVSIFQSHVQVNYIDSLEQKPMTLKAMYFWFVRKRNLLKQIFANRRTELF